MEGTTDLQREHAIDIECTRHSFKHFAGIIVTTAILVCVMGFLLRGRTPGHRLEIWMGALYTLLAIRTVIAILYRRRRPTDEALGPWLAALAVTLPLSALLWGCVVFVSGRSDDALANTAAFVFTGGIMAGGAQSLIGTPRTYIAISVGLIGPSVVFFFTSEIPEHKYLGMTALIYFVAVGNMARQNYQLLRSNINLRFGNLDLVQRLTVEKARAEAARDLAERATASKDQFLAAASHDIRQPIHAAFLFLGALEQRADESRRDLVDGLRVSLVAARQMLDALLDVSKLDAGVVERSDIATEASMLAARIEALLQPVADRKALTLRFHAPPGLWFNSDPTLCQRILVNLTSNALKYTDRGGVLVCFRRSRGECLVQVWDTGIGVPAGQLESIFEEFKQLDNPERDGSRGIGLGLSIVRRLCQLLGSRIDVRSVVGRGSVFSFRLPLATALAPAAGLATAQRSPSRARLLVVDDNAMIRDGLCALLSAWDYEVAVAASIEEACRVATANPDLDLLLVDYRLPGEQTGIDAIDAIVETLGRRIPAVIITGDTSPDRIREANRGGHPVIFKPLPPDVLKLALERALDAD